MGTFWWIVACVVGIFAVVLILVVCLGVAASDADDSLDRQARERPPARPSFGRRRR